MYHIPAPCTTHRTRNKDLSLGYHGQSITSEVVGDDEDILDTGWLVELHGGFHSCEIHMDELQQCMGPNRAETHLGYSLLKSTALLAASYQGVTVFDHHRPPEAFLCQGQHALLPLMSCIMMYTI